MSRYADFRESSATETENSYDYRVEWDDCIRDYDYDKKEVIHQGYDSIDYPHDYDGAYEAYCKLKHDPYHIHVRLIRIDNYGNEITLFP